jgi:hypothetical protein
MKHAALLLQPGVRNGLHKPLAAQVEHVVPPRFSESQSPDSSRDQGAGYSTLLFTAAEAHHLGNQLIPNFPNFILSQIIPRVGFYLDDRIQEPDATLPVADCLVHVV